MGDVHPAAGVLGEQGVAGDDARLGDRRPARQAQPPGDLTLVAAGLRAGEGGVLAVLGDHAVEGPHVLQRPAHHPAVGDAVAVVGEDLHAGAGAVHQAELGQLGAGEALGDRADRHDVDQPGGAAEVEDALGGLGGVGDRVGVGHGEHGGVATDRRGPRAGGDRLDVLAARLAQVGVQVDEPGQQGQPVGIDPLGVRGGVDGADLGDHAVAQEHVAALGGAVGVVPGGPGEEHGAHATAPSPASRW